MESRNLGGNRAGLKWAFVGLAVLQLALTVGLTLQIKGGMTAVALGASIAAVASIAANIWVFHSISRRIDAESAQMKADNDELVRQREEIEGILSRQQEHQEELQQALDLAEIQKSMQEHASRRFQSLFEGLPIGAATFDAEGTIFESNPQMAELTGIPTHHAVLHPIANSLRWEDGTELLEGIIGQVMHDGEMVSVERSFEVGSQMRTVNFRFFPLRNRDGNILGGIVCGLDITEQVAAQRRLEDMAALQGAVLDAAEYSIVWADENCSILGMNRAAEQMLGYSEAECLGQKRLSDFHPKTEIGLRMAEIEATTGDILETGPDLFAYLAAKPGNSASEWQYQTSGNGQVDVNLSLNEIRTEGGGIRGYLTVAKDITEEKAVAEQLKMLSMVARQSMNSVLILDPAACIIYANEAFRRLSGFEFGEVVGETPFAFRSGADPKCQNLTELGQALRRHGEYQGEILFKRPDGEEYWSRVSITPIKNESGICTHIVVIEDDVTEQKEAQIQIAKSEARFRDVVESAGEYVWEVNADFRFTYVSQKVEDVLGFLPEELLGHNPLDYIERSEVREVQNRLAESVLDGLPVKNLLLNSHGKYGQRVWQRFNAIPVFDDAGELAGFRGTSLDVTEQKMAEDALATANMRIKRILESINDSFYSLDSSGRYTYINASAAASMGVEAIDLIGMSIWDSMPEDFWQPVRELFDRVQVTGEAENMEFMYPPTGSWLEFRTYKNLDGGISVFYQNITNRKDAERQIEDQMAALNEANVQMEIQQSMLQEANEKLLNLASTDGLTGLKNHKTFQEFLSDKMAAADTAGISIGVSLMDVDKFKLFNDGFGHLAGDEVLKRVAKTLQENVPAPHFVARYGGEEFVIVGVGLTEDGMVELAEDCRIAIEEQDWPHRQVTASFGVSMYTKDVESKAELIDRADQALYASKEAGRNRVTVWSKMKEPKAA